MKLPEKTSRFLPLAVLFWLCSLVQVCAQDWQEYHVLNNGNQLSWSRQVLFNGNIVRQPDASLGSLTTALNGSQWNLTFTPVSDAVGVAEFIIEYFPNQFPPAPKIEAFRVYVGTSYVTAGKDYFSVELNSEDNALEVLGNDVGHGSQSLYISHITARQHGDASISQDSQLVLFTPEPDFTGVAYVSYVVCDNLGACARTEVDILVRPGAPGFNDTIRLSTNSEAPVTAFMPSSSFSVDDAPDHGTLTDLGGLAWEYLPHAGFTGSDHFLMTDGQFTRLVKVNVFYQDKANTFVNPDIVFTKINEPVTFNVWDNDVKAYPVNAYTEPDEGNLAYNGGGSFTFTPVQDYFGAQEFTYTTCFLSNCETGQVVVYVGDMVPENSETYNLSTSRDVPLVLNYEIPIEGYTFIIHANPSQGDLTLYNNQQTIDVECDEVSGFDLMVYQPDPGFTGEDYFEIYYGIDGGAYHLVKINVDVRDNDALNCPCVDHCVWPGDADGSGQVDLYDVLSIGWQTGMTGPGRGYPDNTSWMGQSAEPWNSDLWGMNSKYADSDGDGVVAAADISSVSEHYLLKHTLVPEVTGLKADYPFNIVPLTTELDSGDLAVFEISIGSEVYPVLDMHGVAFSLNLPIDLIDTSTVTMSFYQDAWLGHDAPTVELIKQPSGRLDAAFTRTSGKPASGIGAIGVMTCIITDDIEGIKSPDAKVPVRIGVNAARGMSSSGLTYDLPATPGTAYITHGAKITSDLADNVFVFPNPSSGSELSIHVNGDRSLRKVEIYDLSGVLISDYSDLRNKQLSPDVSRLGNGFYILRITTTDGVVSKKFEIVK